MPMLLAVVLHRVVTDLNIVQEGFISEQWRRKKNVISVNFAWFAQSCSASTGINLALSTEVGNAGSPFTKSLVPCL